MALATTDARTITDVSGNIANLTKAGETEVLANLGDSGDCDEGDDNSSDDNQDDGPNDPQQPQNDSQQQFQQDGPSQTQAPATKQNADSTIGEEALRYPDVNLSFDTPLEGAR